MNKLLNQNIEVKQDENILGQISLINTINGIELARFNSNSEIKVWINSGGYQTKEVQLWDSQNKQK